MNQINHCRDCRWHMSNGQCWAVEFEDEPTGEHPAVLDVTVADDCGLEIKFLTASDFGCTQWASRSP